MEKKENPIDTNQNEPMSEMKNDSVSEPTAPAESTDDQVADPVIDLSSAMKEDDAAEKKIAELTNELANAKDQALRSLAELENFRNRKNREIAELHKYESMALARDILPVWDNMGRALAASEQDLNVETLIEGVRMMHQQFLDILKKHNITRIEAVGSPFDPNIHESISMLPSDKPAGEVIAEGQVGFMLRDRVVRPTQVVVSAPKKRDAE